MQIDAYFAPGQVRDGDVEGRAAIVIDVIRATSCITEAIANGARAIFPTESIEDATRLRASLDRDLTLLCGERKGVRIDGFDLGNSPAEFSRDVVAGRQLVMTTTNGTRAFVAAADADRVLSASFLNLGAVVEAVSVTEDLVVVCAGKEDRFSLDDAVCAGHIIRRVQERAGAGVTLNDAALAATDLAATHGVSTAFLAATAAGRALVDVGLESDLALCAAADKHTIVPMMYDRMITAPRPA